MFSSVIVPILLFGGLVFFHELGHFAVAKWCNVYVERFAIGFGPALLKWTWGETEYALCAFPLGGYVKMRGQEDIGEANPEHANDPRSFMNLNVWKRIAIVIMGPVANLILPVILFTGLFMVGVPSPSTVVGNVLPDSPASKAGLRDGDKVLSVQGQSVDTFRQMSKLVQARAGLSTEFVIQRGQETLQEKITPESKDGLNDFGQDVAQGTIGISMVSYQPVVGVSDPNSLAYQKGIRTGLIITAINGEPVRYMWQAQQKVREATGPIQIALRGNNPDLTPQEQETFDVSLGTITDLSQAGLFDAQVFLAEVKEGSAAFEKGLKKGDHITDVNNKPINSWNELTSAIDQNTGQALDISVIRDGQPIAINLVPKEVNQRNELTHVKESVRQLGVVSAVVAHPMNRFVEQYKNIFSALSRGFKETVHLTRSTVIGLGKLFTGQLGVKTLGGPISIFYMAGTSYDSGGWMSFFRLMALLSITLGVLNLLPIPVLDGGHLMFYFIEVIKGKPLPDKIIGWFQQAGMVALLGLMLLVFYVDIDRFFVDKIKALFS